MGLLISRIKISYIFLTRIQQVINANDWSVESAIVSLDENYFHFRICISFLGTYLVFDLLKFMYSEKATNVFKICTVDLSYVVRVKSTVHILQMYVVFSEYMNFNRSKTRNVPKKLIHILKWKTKTDYGTFQKINR